MATLETPVKTVWNLDTTHSEISFKIKHLVISTVTGYFRSFEAHAESSKEDFSDAQISFSADINSIDTNQEQRDAHLKSPEFFDAAQFSKLTFQSTSLVKKSGNEYELHGNLTIKNVSKPVKLKAELGGTAKDFYGNIKAGFELSGKISRKEFGLTWDAITEAGAIVVGDEVKLELNVQLSRPA